MEDIQDLPSIRQEFDSLKVIVEANQRMLQALETKQVTMGIGNLQVAALKLLFRHNNGGESRPSSNKPSVETLINWSSKMPAKNLPSATQGLLRPADHSKLTDSDFLQRRNKLGFENWDKLAALLNKPHYSQCKNNWSRIFLFVTGKEMDEAAKDGEAQISRLHSKVLQAVVDEEDFDDDM
ncbi:hypothetical protein ABW21_db0201574 [Orbilia brochopaga]|nr:hypothetical protein ABW21_db0201574 [Drechslerella brochopaga]